MRVHRESLGNLIKPPVGPAGPGVRAVRPLTLTLALLAALFAGLAFGTAVVRAQASTFTTTTAVAPGGTLTLAVTGGPLITGTSITTCSATTPPPAASVTYMCSSGLNAGTIINQNFSTTSGAATETVTYNANGPITGFPGATAATTNTGNCTAAAGPPGTSTCGGITTTAATIPGGTFVLTVTGAAGQTVQITGAPPLGTCPLTTPPPTAVSAPAGTVSVTYTCAAGQSIPSGTGISNSVLVSTGGAIGTPTVSASSNANAPVPATGLIPAPTNQSVTVAAGLPSITSVTPTSGPQGTIVTVTGLDLASVSAINFNGTPGSNLSCISTGTSCTVTAPSFSLGTTASVTAVGSGGTSNPLSFTFSSTIGGGSTGTGISVTYNTGWNIVGGPSGTVVTGNNGPLYTYQAGDTNYEQVPSGSPLTAPRGYWAYFNSATTSTLATVSSQSLVVSAPVGAWFMIGNPGNTSATVSGADIAYTYSVGPGYQAATILNPGQGAWAWSWTGAQITIRNQ